MKINNFLKSKMTLFSSNPFVTENKIGWYLAGYSVSGHTGNPKIRIRCIPLFDRTLVFHRICPRDAAASMATNVKYWLCLVFVNLKNNVSPNNVWPSLGMRWRRWRPRAPRTATRHRDTRLSGWSEGQEKSSHDSLHKYFDFFSYIKMV